MNEGKNKTCPVCHKDLPEGADACPFCGFDQLDRIFLDKEEYEAWSVPISDFAGIGCVHGSVPEQNMD